MKNTSNVIAGIPMLKCGKQRSTGLYRELFDCLQSYNPYQEGRGAFYDSAAAAELARLYRIVFENDKIVAAAIRKGMDNHVINV